jgi:hypothetical protein
VSQSYAAKQRHHRSSRCDAKLGGNHPASFCVVLPRVGSTTMNRNFLYVLVGALVVGVGVLSYSLYQEKKEPSGLQINLGPDGLKVQNK